MVRRQWGGSAACPQPGSTASHNLLSLSPASSPASPAGSLTITDAKDLIKFVDTIWSIRRQRAIVRSTSERDRGGQRPLGHVGDLVQLAKLHKHALGRAPLLRKVHKVAQRRQGPAPRLEPRDRSATDELDLSGVQVDQAPEVPVHPLVVIFPSNACHDAAVSVNLHVDRSVRRVCFRDWRAQNARRALSHTRPRAGDQHRVERLVGAWNLVVGLARGSEGGRPQQ
mmetsp:Transcript_40097/g.85632  ORF Transcript_40097/g.85632 Transcript_40097/m.85632 type:complete len:226 (+) Transcript_40097:265-942(+)